MSTSPRRRLFVMTLAAGATGIAAAVSAAHSVGPFHGLAVSRPSPVALLGSSPAAARVVPADTLYPPAAAPSPSVQVIYVHDPPRPAAAPPAVMQLRSARPAAALPPGAAPAQVASSPTAPATPGAVPPPCEDCGGDGGGGGGGGEG